MIKEILVVEDDQSVLKYLKELLTENNFSVKTANDGTSALDLISRQPPDLVILDLGLPNLTGESVLQEIRKKNPKLPVIILTGKDSVANIVHGLSIGADDYMTKPFVADELLARIKARLRNEGDGESVLRVDDLILNPKSLEVKRADISIDLTPHEFKLLEYLMINKNQVLSRDMILNRVWSYSPDVETRVVDVFMGYLRKKVDAKFKKKLIKSVRGFGYTVKDN
ncbi:response regulator transcription factor [Candidatus Microgenomates bacterium]|nr:response regulator transcription factor [Candidatus Microgenomates bacterium]